MWGSWLRTGFPLLTMVSLARALHSFEPYIDCSPCSGRREGL